MNTIRKRIALFALCLAMLVPAVLTSSFAAEGVRVTAESAAAANVLNELGLFNGKGTNADGTPIYALDETATRIEGLVMLIRLLGEEGDALAYEGECPFTDVPTWAERHAAYAYGKGYVNGTTATTYTPDGKITGQQYAVLILRALGFNEKTGDFTYDKACEKAVEVGLFDAVEDYTGDFFRGDIVTMSLRAMTTDTKEGRYLSEQLKEKINTQKFADALVKHDLVKKQETGIVYIPYNKKENKIYAEDICAAFPDAACFVSSGDNIPSSGIDWQSLEQQKNLLLINRFVKSYVSGESSTLDPLTMSESEKLNSYGYVTVLDKDYNLIAYFTYPSINSVGDTLAFTTCFVEGKPEIERVRTLLQNVQSYNVESLFYRENITTIHPDGTETIATYLRLDESKLPAYLRENAVYYGSGPGAGNTSLAMQILRRQMAFQNHSTNPSDVTCFAIGADYLLWSPDAKYRENFSWAFYDENKDMIGIVTPSEDITFNAVETIIDLRE